MMMKIMISILELLKKSVDQIVLRGHLNNQKYQFYSAY